MSLASLVTTNINYFKPKFSLRIHGHEGGEGEKKKLLLQIQHYGTLKRFPFGEDNNRW